MCLNTKQLFVRHHTINSHCILVYCNSCTSSTLSQRSCPCQRVPNMSISPNLPISKDTSGILKETDSVLSWSETHSKSAIPQQHNAKIYRLGKCEKDSGYVQISFLNGENTLSTMWRRPNIWSTYKHKKIPDYDEQWNRLWKNNFLMCVVP